MGYTISSMTNAAYSAASFSLSARQNQTQSQNAATTQQANQNATQNVSGNPLNSALQAANDRISAQGNQLQTQVSTLGQIKSSYASVENIGKALTSIDAKATTTDIKNAAQKFVDAVNTTQKLTGDAVSNTTGVTGATWRARSWWAAK